MEQEILVPDIGDFNEVDVIDVLVSEGDSVTTEQPLITLESDKAAMDVPSPYDGKVKYVLVKAGDKVSMGSKILGLEVEKKANDAKQSSSSQGRKDNGSNGQSPVIAPEENRTEHSEKLTSQKRNNNETKPVSIASESAFETAHASPSVRRYAREHGVNLHDVQGSGRKGRILKEDVEAFINGKQGKHPDAGMILPGMPDVDFSKFGETETIELNRIRKISATNLQRNWVNIPHVTHFDEADITELDAFRKQQAEAASKQDLKLTILPFIMKACAAALKAFPEFNASLAAGGERLVLKKYVHIGIAVDTPDGLLVPVVRDVDKKGVLDLTRDLMELSQKARDKKLSPGEMQGGCFSISNLGGIGGYGFTPIINAPEVAILGMSRSEIKPVYRDGEFVPRLMLPLSLSYDHRVIDGAKAARFSAYLTGVISDIRKVLL